MSTPTGTVQRWDAYVQTEGALFYVDWIEDETGEYVTYDDHKTQVDDWECKCRDLCFAHGALLFEHDALKKQAAALATALKALHADSMASDFNEHWDSFTQAQAILDAHGRKG